MSVTIQGCYLCIYLLHNKFIALILKYKQQN